jgi:hypothetical protein
MGRMGAASDRDGGRRATLTAEVGCPSITAPMLKSLWSSAYAGRPESA